MLTPFYRWVHCVPEKHKCVLLWKGARKPHPDRNSRPHWLWQTMCPLLSCPPCHYSEKKPTAGWNRLSQPLHHERGFPLKSHYERKDSKCQRSCFICFGNDWGMRILQNLSWWFSCMSLEDRNFFTRSGSLPPIGAGQNSALCWKSCLSPEFTCSNILSIKDIELMRHSI